MPVIVRIGVLREPGRKVHVRSLAFLVSSRAYCMGEVILPLNPTRNIFIWPLSLCLILCLAWCYKALKFGLRN